MLAELDMRAVSMTGLSEWEWVCGRVTAGFGFAVTVAVVTSDGSGHKRTPEAYSLVFLVGWAVHLPQFIIERVGGVIKDGVHHVHHPPLCHCLQTVQFLPDHRAGLSYQIYWHYQPWCCLPKTLQPRTVQWTPLILSRMLYTLKDLSFLAREGTFCYGSGFCWCGPQGTCVSPSPLLLFPGLLFLFMFWSSKESIVYSVMQFVLFLFFSVLVQLLSKPPGENTYIVWIRISD